MTEPDTAEEFIVVDAHELENSVRLAVANGVRVERVAASGLEPVSTATVLLLGTVTAVATVVNLLDRRKGGQVIDLRKGSPLAVYRSPDVVYGLVVVITRAGVVTVEVREPKGMFGTVCESLVSVMTDLGKAGTDEVAKEIEATFGPDEISVRVEKNE